MPAGDLEAVYRVEAGAAGSPVILHVPHSSRELTPLARRGLMLDDQALSAELDAMTDAYTDLIATQAAGAAAFPPWSFVNRYSRLVVDPERFPDEREEMQAVGMGAVYTRTSHGQPLRSENQSRAEALLVTHYRPYAAAMTALVDDRLSATGRAVIIDVHSYPSRALPYELHSGQPRPAVCLGTDPAHTPAQLLGAARLAFAPLGDLDVDTPFAGCYVPLRHYRRQPAVTALMVEIRRDTYMIEPAGPPTAGIEPVIEALTTLINAVSGTGQPGRTSPVS